MKIKLSAEEIVSNWDTFISNIDEYISEPRRSKLKDFYTKYQERIMMMPASHKKEYHSAFPGGYVDHVNRVVRCAVKQRDLWASEGVDITTFTLEELVFSAINHDLGKWVTIKMRLTSLRLISGEKINWVKIIPLILNYHLLQYQIEVYFY